ncbi:MAG TPA: VTT domain-containing protein [Burkholderiales bacterium]|nr:VTT domain-containing protein [Burkholderiales bacterium]
MVDLSSLLQKGRNCCAIARADRVALLVDGEAYFQAFMQACLRAQRSITILAWDFNSKTRLTYADDVGHPPLLGEFLNYLTRRRRRLHINILDWDYPMVFGGDREFSPLYGLSWAPHRRVHMHYDDTHPVSGSHHQKVVVIDEKIAFVGGFDLTCKRWDTPAHDPNEPRRTADNKPYPPFHDLMVLLDGEAASVLADLARTRWLRATGHRLPRTRVDGDAWPREVPIAFENVEVGIACTTPAASDNTEVRDVEQLYLDMIASAKRHIYIENQYFTCRKIGEALAARLREKGGPEIVLVTRLLSHGWLEEMTMHVLRTQLVHLLQTADHEQRFSVYYPHVEGLAPGTCIDVHSKMMAVDDECLRIGSANLSNRSMGLDSECDVLIEARGNEKVRNTIRDFRFALMAEHLNVATEEVARAVEATGSMQKAIAMLNKPDRTLKPLDDLPEYSETIVSTAAWADMEKPVSLDSLVEQFAPELKVEPRRARLWMKIGGTAAIFAGMMLIWRYTPLAEVFTAEAVTQWAADFSGHWWAPLLIILAYTPACVVMFPRPLITLAAVVAFGPYFGFVYALSGIVLAALISYVAGRAFDRDTVRRIAGEKLNRLSHVLQARGLMAMTAVRIVPVAPFVVSSLVAGAIRIRLWHYVAGTLIGMLPGVLAATIFGDQLEAALRDPSQINYWLVGGILALLVGGAVAVRRWFARLDRELPPHPQAEAQGAH